MTSLLILGAAYGPANVTDQVRGMQTGDTLTVLASDSVFGDPWSGHKKSLVVVYMYVGFGPEVKVVAEGSTLTIDGPNVARPQKAPEHRSGTLAILGAAYGLGDVTKKVRSQVVNNALTTTANNATYSDTWSGVVKTMVVVYEYYENPLIQIVLENQQMTVQDSPALQILGATYGTEPVALRLSSQIDVFQEIHATVSSTLFGEPDPGLMAQLAVVYQYGQEQPQTRSFPQNQPFSISYTATASYTPPHDPATLTILGGVYGASDVTTTLKGLVVDNRLTVTASDETFGKQSGSGTPCLTVIYQYGPGAAQTQVCARGDQISIRHDPTVTSDLVPARDLLESGDVINLIAMNHCFLTRNPSDGRLLANGATSADCCVLTVELKDGGVVLQTEGKYVRVGAEQRLYADTTNAAEATPFTVAIAAGTGIHLSSNGLYAALCEDGSIAVSATDYTMLLTSFDLGMQAVSEETMLARRGIARLDPPTPCQLAMASFVWSLTGGFLLAIGIGPFVATGKAETGLFALLRSNTRVWTAIETLLETLASNKAITSLAALGVIKVIYDQGLMWSVVKFLLSTLGWAGVARALSKVIEVVLVPEVEAADLLASFVIWSYDTTKAGLAANAACRTRS